MNRRDFLGSLAGVALAAGSADTWRRSTAFKTPPLPEGGIVGAADGFGHRLRTGAFPAPTETLKASAIIVGGGIAGLSAGWKLLKSGCSDFLILELEPAVGGNARWGQNAISAYPWGAHYLPFPTEESRAARELLADFGVLLGDPFAPAPSYDERYINFAPQERLYAHGVWHESLWPQIGVRRRDLDQYHRFQDLMADYRTRRGADGRKAFAIPIDFSARDAALLALDRLSMRDFLLRQGLDSEPLHWYVNYACRDDYGCRYEQTSAWMGIHYFASRDALAQDADGDDVLTWPEGNGWLVERLRERLAAHLVTDALVWRIAELDRALAVDAWRPHENRSTRHLARAAIWAAPVFQAPTVFRELAPELTAAIREFQYAPWLVANLSLRAFPEERRGAPLSWDNVLYDSGALGYVVATHQHLTAHADQTVFTWYQALCDGPPAQERQRLLATPWATWAEYILNDLSRPHPDIRQLVTRLDAMRWGHAMVCPRPGFVWSEARQRLERMGDRIAFAHSDLSGYSVFEEANYRGVLAAERVLRMLD
ncbi:MAG: NAD(P)-binding protein [Candidatus Competibacteraceae bacterium]|nr:NAD(P)-binding protein [Candidatus Competibacteraceae bacterium]MBK7984912.1 NAD(P)-binding protein [Candidatus Competibacteraceae bacterium]MBK8962680.1 NAD(P)-binding protein [Candidatus Competibacteraceae bacterium]MBK9953394.1 NAD(P)-binding protein [Candidatus Competibacteraceae bacterium]